MRVHINSTEWYPVFDIWQDETRGKYSLPIEVIERYQAAKVALERAIEEVDAIIDQHHAPNQDKERP